MSKTAILLAGGRGTRISTMSHGLPKPMIDVGGRPFIKYILDFLVENDFKKIIITVSFKHWILQNKFGSSYKECDLIWSIEEEALGTGGAIKKVFDDFDLSSAFIFNADTFFNIDFKYFQFFCSLKNPDIVLSLRQVRDVSRYGKVVVDKNGIVTLFKEKGDSGPGLINGGVYFVDKSFLRFAPKGVFSFEEFILQSFLKESRIHALECKGYFIDIGIPNDLIKAREELPKIIKGVNKWLC